MPTLSQIRDYLQGMIRMFFYKRKWLKFFFLSNYVIKEFENRKKLAKNCYENGKCTHCGCKTPELFFANRGCSNKEIPCYKKLTHWYSRISG